jgi:CDP-paratose 2-epimerase
MSIAVVTGSGGLVGSEITELLINKGMLVLGFDNDTRGELFGKAASTAWRIQELVDAYGGNDRYIHYGYDITNQSEMESVFSHFGRDIRLVVHTAGQPSHDWAANQPLEDFKLNAWATAVMLEVTRRYAHDAAFIHMSTNKVYGDRPNQLPFVELPTRWELPIDHRYYQGIGQAMSVDQCLHSVFGANKAGADLLVQEYGRYFGMNTVVFRGGCLTGPKHAGTMLHGFLSHLMHCAVSGRQYTILGYKGKQVRDNLHSKDLAAAMWQFFQHSHEGVGGEVYNIGGGRYSNCSILEAIKLCEEITGREMNHTYSPDHRIGDHRWWISDTSKFRSHYPDWHVTYNVPQILEEIYAEATSRMWASQAS